MFQFIALDSGPLWLACLAIGKPAGDDCRRWLEQMLQAGHRIILPEIADYETRRELIRRRATASLARLDDLKSRLDYRPIATASVIRAAELWADVRQSGTPTAHPEALDGDCIVAAQAIVRRAGGRADRRDDEPDAPRAIPGDRCPSMGHRLLVAHPLIKIGPDLARLIGQRRSRDSLGIDRAVGKRANR